MMVNIECVGGYASEGGKSSKREPVSQKAIERGFLKGGQLSLHNSTPVIPAMREGEAGGF